MLTGKRFRIKTPTLAIDDTTADKMTVTLPIGALVAVIDGPHGPENPLVRITWESKWLIMFEKDIRERCEEIPGDSAVNSTGSI